MRSVLFVVSIYNYHREVSPVIKAFCAQGWKTTVLLGWVGENAEIAAEAYANMGCHVLRTAYEHSYREVSASVPGQATSNLLGSSERKSRSLRSVLKKIISLSPQLFRLATVPLTAMHMYKAGQFAKAILRQVSPDIVFQGPFHSVGKVDNGIYKGAGQIGIPRCCYPVSAYHGRQNVIRSRISNIRSGMLSSALWHQHDTLNKVFAVFFPAWVNCFEGKRFFMSDPMNLFAARLIGLELDDIWQKPQPGFDNVFVYSKFSANLLNDGTFPMERVKICGIPLLDDVISNLNSRIAQDEIYIDLGLRAESNFLLFNVEPSLEHHYADSKTHWNRFNAIMERLANIGMPIILSLHPLCQLEDYIFAEKKHSVIISRKWKIHQLYPMCSMVVSFPCSTNVIAEIFSKPLVIYDYMRLCEIGSSREQEFRLPLAKIGHTLDDIQELVIQTKGQINPSIKIEKGVALQKATASILTFCEDLMKEKPS